MRRVFLSAVLFWSPCAVALAGTVEYHFTFNGQITSFSSSLDTPGGPVPLPGPTFSAGQIFAGSAYFRDSSPDSGSTGFNLGGFLVAYDNNSSTFGSGVLNINLYNALGSTPFVGDPSLNFNPGFMTLGGSLSGNLETGDGTFSIYGFCDFSPNPHFILSGNLTELIEVPEPSSWTLILLAAGAVYFRRFSERFGAA